MNPITSLLFEELDRVHQLCGPVVLVRLIELGAQIEKVTTFSHRVEYQDEEVLTGVINIGASGKISGIILASRIKSDSEGWNTWSKEAEMKRLALQQNWLESRRITTRRNGPLRISNCFSPQDGASAISIFPTDDSQNGRSPLSAN